MAADALCPSRVGLPVYSRQRGCNLDDSELDAVLLHHLLVSIRLQIRERWKQRLVFAYGLVSV